MIREARWGKGVGSSRKQSWKLSDRNGEKPKKEQQICGTDPVIGPLVARTVLSPEIFQLLLF